MTAVVVLGDIPSAGIIRQASAGRVRVDSAGGAGSDFVAYATEELQEHKALIALYPAWRPASAHRLIQLARAMLDTDRIAGVPLNLPPLAFSLVADQLAYLSRHVSPGLLASLAHRLPFEILAGAWVNSVAKLEHIEIDLGKHMRSYLPGTEFMVAATPHPAVHRITAGHPVTPLTYRPADPLLMLAAHEDGGADWLKSKLAPAVGAASLNFVGAQPLSAEFWGTKKYAEFVAFSGHPQALQNTIRATPCRPCRWCGEPTALPTCPFCLMVQPPPQQAGSPAAQGAPAPQPAAAPPPTAEPPAAQPQAGRPGAAALPYEPEPTAYHPQPASAQPAQWYGPQQRRDVPSPPRRQDQSPPEDNRQAAASERAQTVTFAVPERALQNGTNGSAPTLDSPSTSPPMSSTTSTTSTSNGASSPHEGQLS